MRRVPAITPEQENFRVVPVPGLAMTTIRRDPVEPVPVGSYVAVVFRVDGYDKDCDGSLMARLSQVDADGDPTGWEVAQVGLYPGTEWALDRPDELDALCSRDET